MYHSHRPAPFDMVCAAPPCEKTAYIRYCQEGCTEARVYVEPVEGLFHASGPYALPVGWLLANYGRAYCSATCAESVTVELISQ